MVWQMIALPYYIYALGCNGEISNRQVGHNINEY
jgi:hypothetical protein